MISDHLAPPSIHAHFVHGRGRCCSQSIFSCSAHHADRTKSWCIVDLDKQQSIIWEYSTKDSSFSTVIRTVDPVLMGSPSSLMKNS